MPNITSATIPNATQGIASNDTSVMLNWLNWLSLWRFDFVASTAKVNSLLTNPSGRECSRRLEYTRTKNSPARAGPVCESRNNAVSSLLQTRGHGNAHPDLRCGRSPEVALGRDAGAPFAAQPVRLDADALTAPSPGHHRRAKTPGTPPAPRHSPSFLLMTRRSLFYNQEKSAL